VSGAEDAPRGGQPPDGIRTIPPASVLSTRLVLVRHGESACNVAGVVGGPVGCTGLSPVGVGEAEALRDRLVATGELVGAAAVYASVLPRARETAAIAAPGLGGLVAVADCDLCELHPGEADGLTWTEFSERYRAPDWDLDPDAELAPGAESWTGFVRRVATALAEKAAAHPGQLVVIFCHGGVVEASLESFLSVSPDHGRLKLRTCHTSLTEWELVPDGWRLLRYNDAAHLLGVPTPLPVP
jgi:2,3-bisphosphoglycerate-dependent phosphoglycerate mutase